MYQVNSVFQKKPMSYKGRKDISHGPRATKALINVEVHLIALCSVLNKLIMSHAILVMKDLLLNGAFLLKLISLKYAMFTS